MSSGSTTNLFGDHTNITESMFIARDSFQYYVSELPEEVKNSALIQSKISEINLLFEDYMRKVVQEKRHNLLEYFGTNVEALIVMMMGVGLLIGCAASIWFWLSAIPCLAGIGGFGYLAYKTYQYSQQEHDDLRQHESVINMKVAELLNLQRQQGGAS
jgi:hypothetical protein